MVRTQIRITEAQDRRLELLALARHVSRAEPVRQAVDMLLASESPSLNVRELRAHALAVAGAYHSRRGDVAEQHDAELAAA